MEKINNISKAEALDYTKHFGEKVYVIERMVQSTFYGADYQNDFDDIYSMSYFCRAFNITEYGASRQKNKIKGRYKKYAKVDGAEGYFRQILNAKWPGFKDENPRMDDLLARYPQENIFEKKTESATGFRTCATTGSTTGEHIFHTADGGRAVSSGSDSCDFTDYRSYSSVKVESGIGNPLSNHRRCRVLSGKERQSSES